MIHAKLPWSRRKIADREKDQDRDKHEETPNKRRALPSFNAISGMSERTPHNVIDLGEPRNWPIRWKRLLFFVYYPLRLLDASVCYTRARGKTLWYYTLHIHKSYRLVESESKLLGEDAYNYVRTLFRRVRTRVQDLDDDKRFLNADRVIEEFKSHRDMTYFVIKGLPTISWPFRYAKDEEIPEKDLDVQWLKERLSEEPQPDDHLWQEKAKKRRKEIRDALNKRFEHADFMIAGLARLLECEVSGPQKGIEPLARNLITDPSELQWGDTENIDMSLRFLQSTSHNEIPLSLGSEDKSECCAYVVYLCVKNPLWIPIHLVSVPEIIKDHLCKHETLKTKTVHKRKTVLENLEKDQFERGAPRFDEYGDFQPQPGTKKSPVLREDNGNDFTMLFDSERVTPPNPDSEVALVELRHAIRRARRDAIRVVLEPGDILVVDNLRAMVSRREFHASSLMDLLHLLPSVLFKWITKKKDPKPPHASIKTVTWLGSVPT